MLLMTIPSAAQELVLIANVKVQVRLVHFEERLDFRNVLNHLPNCVKKVWHLLSLYAMQRVRLDDLWLEEYR